MPFLHLSILWVKKARPRYIRGAPVPLFLWRISEATNISHPSYYTNTSTTISARMGVPISRPPETACDFFWYKNLSFGVIQVGGLLEEEAYQLLVTEGRRNHKIAKT